MILRFDEELGTLANSSLCVRYDLIDVKLLNCDFQDVEASQNCLKLDYDLVQVKQ